MTKFKLIYLVFLVYFIAAIILTFPLVIFLDKYLIGKGGLDGFQYIWNIFSFWHQISHFQSPFFTNLIFYPLGANLFFNDYSPLVSLFAWPFLKHPVTYLNLIVIFGLTFSALTAFYLAKYITKNSLAACLSGFIYGFSPTSASFISTQHYYYLVASIFLPLGVLCLLKFIDAHKKYLMLFVTICWVLFFINYYFFILLILLSLIFLVNVIIFDPLTRQKLFSSFSLRYYLKVFLLGVVIPCLIILQILFRTEGSQSFIGSSNNYATICNANLIGLMMPSSQKTYSFFNFPESGDTPYYYLGAIFIFVVLLCIAFFRKEKYVLPLAVTMFIILLFSLGLNIRFGSMILLDNYNTPFYWLSKLPFLGLIDCPVRFVSGVHLFIALIVAIFISKILKRNLAVSIFLVSLFLITLLTDYKLPQFPLIKVDIPEVYQRIADYPDNRTVLELPSGLAESKKAFGYDGAIEGLHTREMYWGTISKKPRVGGYISRIPQSTYNYFLNKPIISDLFVLTSLNGIWSNKHFSLKEKNQFINDLNLGYIIIAPEVRQKEFSRAVEQVLSGIPYEKASYGSYLLYRINWSY